MEDHFHRRMVKADKCGFKKYTEQDFIKADKELNVLYRKIMGLKEFIWGTVTREGIKSTQKSWIGYRDAWVAFGKLRCSKISAVSWKTLITLERIEQLKEFAHD